MESGVDGAGLAQPNGLRERSDLLRNGTALAAASLCRSAKVDRLRRAT